MEEENSETPKCLQKKLYFYLDNLKTMHSALPEIYQMRISYELLTVLANSLMNETLFKIVKSLMEIQHVTEKHLMQLREQAETENEMEIEQWKKKITDPEELDHILTLLKTKHDKKLRETDLKLMQHIDQKVHDQQSTLEKAGVPGFYVTDNSKDIKIQMHLLDFILRLSQLESSLNK